MSLHVRKPEPVPEETARVARAAFPRGNAYIRMRDELDTIYEDEQFERLFPHRGQPPPASGYPGAPGGLRWSRSSSSSRTSPTGRRPMP